ncbi:MAG: hypothetical protein ACTMIV_10880 [Brevibacterium aurantiacum]
MMQGNPEKEPLGIWKTLRELGVFAIAAAVGVALSPQDSGWWLGLPLILLLLATVEMRRPESQMRTSWVVASMMLVRAFLGGYFSALLAISVHGNLSGDEIAHFTLLNNCLMIVCLLGMGATHLLERYVQRFE